MREIITIQVGQCGNHIGTKFWNVISEEHGLNKQGYYINEEIKNSTSDLGKIDVCFSESIEKKYYPRALLFDLEPGIINSISNGPMGKLFKPDNYIYGKNGTGNVYAKGLNEGSEMMDQIMDIVRKETENCDSLQGFQLTHSLAGGTGSSMSVKILSSIEETYRSKIIQTFSILPSPNVSDLVLEPYNIIFTLSSLIYYDLVNLIDNEALFDICYKKLNIQSPTYNDLNKLVSNVMSGITSSMRFKGQHNTDLRKQCVNLNLFTRFSYHIVGFSPYHSKNLTINELTTQIFSTDSMLCKCDAKDSILGTGLTIFRGEIISTLEIDQAMLNYKLKNFSSFTDWIPNNISSCVVTKPLKEYQLSSTLVATSSSIANIFDKYNNLFNKLFSKKAYVHLYTDLGMDDMEFTEVYSHISDLSTEYKYYLCQIGQRSHEHDEDGEMEIDE